MILLRIKGSCRNFVDVIGRWLKLSLDAIYPPPYSLPFRIVFASLSFLLTSSRYAHSFKLDPSRLDNDSVAVDPPRCELCWVRVCSELPFLSFVFTIRFCLFLPLHSRITSCTIAYLYSFFLFLLLSPFFGLVLSQSSYRSLRKITAVLGGDEISIHFDSSGERILTENRILFHISPRRKEEQRIERRKAGKREKDKCFRALAKLTLRIGAPGSEFAPVCRRT